MPEASAVRRICFFAEERNVSSCRAAQEKSRFTAKAPGAPEGSPGDRDGRKSGREGRSSEAEWMKSSMEERAASKAEASCSASSRFSERIDCRRLTPDSSMSTAKDARNSWGMRMILLFCER